MMWNAARDQLGNYLSDIEKNRKEAGMANAELRNRARPAVAAEEDALPVGEPGRRAARRVGCGRGDAAARTGSRCSTSSIDLASTARSPALDKAIGGFTPGAVEAVELVETRKALKIANDQVEGAGNRRERSLDLAARDNCSTRRPRSLKSSRSLPKLPTRSIPYRRRRRRPNARPMRSPVPANRSAAKASESAAPIPMPTPTPIAAQAPRKPPSNRRRLPCKPRPIP